MRDIELSKQALEKGCENIEMVFREEGIELKRDSWLGKYLKLVRQIAAGKSPFNPNEFKVHRILAVVVMLGEDLVECRNKKVNLQDKLKNFHKVKNSDSRLHEISVIASLLRNNFSAEFIREEQGRETPDIRLMTKEGVIECKIARNYERIIERVTKAHDQLKEFPGIKIVDVFVYFSITANEIAELGKAVFQRVNQKMLKADNISGIHAINLRFVESRKLENGKLTTAFNGYSIFNENFSNSKEVLTALEEHQGQDHEIL